MRRYETVVVMGADLPEARVKEEISKIEGILASLGAREVKLDRWGTKELGHRMRKHSTGSYLCFTYETENARVMDALVNQLRINDTVLKFQSHRINDKVRKFKGNPRRPLHSEAVEAEDLGLPESEDFGS